jgi:ectoine hydroxylase-related dioxygenase (phytanoyl-CoA dioxygenase family)
MNQIISHSEVDFYRTNGYLLPEEPLFTDEKFLRLKAIFEEILANKEGSLRADLLDTPHFYDERLLDFLLDDDVLDVVENIIGPDFGLWSSHFICKEPKIGRASPWHEDSAYWHGRFDHFEGIVTIWLAIDRSGKDNGCMKVIPGSHLSGDSSYEEVDEDQYTFPSRIPDVDESQAVYLELEPNHYSLHDSRIIHGADANRSSMRRCGYTMRYFSHTMKYQQNAKNKNFKIWHCRGSNMHNNPVVN